MARQNVTRPSLKIFYPERSLLTAENSPKVAVTGTDA